MSLQSRERDPGPQASAGVRERAEVLSRKPEPPASPQSLDGEPTAGDSAPCSGREFVLR